MRKDLLVHRLTYFQLQITTLPNENILTKFWINVDIVVKFLEK